VIIKIESEAEMRDFGVKLGALLNGGELIELVGDIGAGKTTLARGIAVGFGVDEDIQSPSFTINRLYEARDNLMMAHYDFYRLSQAGVMSDELYETINIPSNVTIIEWGQIVGGILPNDRLTISIDPISESSRCLSLEAHGKKSGQLKAKL
jgi:tRNA threonylcarbamoyladenosine biosynthesis protein TsaE